MARAYRKKKTIGSKKEPKKELRAVEPTKDISKEDEIYLRDAEYKLKAMTLFRTASDSRKRYDWEWLTRDLYRRGYQFSRYNPSNRTVILSTRQRIKIPINLTQAQMRIVRNQITAFKPKWEILPRGSSEEAMNNARYSGKLLDYYYDRLNLRTKSKKVVTQGLTYSVGGPWQIGYDPDGDNGEGEIYVWQTDTYDFYVDPHATDNVALTDAEYCFKAVRRPLRLVKANPDYNYTEELNSDGRVAESEYKQFLLQALSSPPYEGNPEDEGVIVKEMWLKERITEKNKSEMAADLKENEQETKDLRMGEVLMRVITYTDTLEQPLKSQLIRRPDFPFVLYPADIEPVSFYGESWIKHIIPMNRVLNALESDVFAYNYRYAKGRLAVQKNSGVRIIANQHGDIVEYNAGTTPPMPIPLNPLQQSYNQQIENMRRYIEDLGGAHETSFGRIPSGIKSGVGIAELKSADASNHQDKVDNFSDFMVEVGKKMLNEIAENYDVPKLVKALGKGGSADHFAIIGEKNTGGRRRKTKVNIGGDIFDLAVIGKDSEIRVTVGSWLAYTKSAQQEKLKEYFEGGIIDQKTFLELAEFADVDSIVERTRKEDLLGKYRGTPAQPGMPTDEEIAMQENFQMTKEGKTPDAQPEDQHDLHLVIHQEELGAVENPIVEAHMAQHEDFIKQGRGDEVKRLTGFPQQIQGTAPPSPEGMGPVPMPSVGGAPMPGGPLPPPPAGGEHHCHQAFDFKNWVCYK